MAVTLGSVALPGDSIWVDEFDWSAVDSSERRTLGGRSVVQHFLKLKARPISLSVQWLTIEQVRSLEALRDTPGLIQQLQVADGRIFQVKFRHTQSPVLQVTPVIERPDYSDPTCEQYFDVIINLLEI